MAASFALMASIGTGTALWIIAAMAVVGRIGLGLVMPSLNLGAMRGLAMPMISPASSTINFLQWRLAARGEAQALAAFGDSFWRVAAVCAPATLAALRMKPVDAPKDDAGAS